MMTFNDPMIVIAMWNTIPRLRNQKHLRSQIIVMSKKTLTEYKDKLPTWAKIAMLC